MANENAGTISVELRLALEKMQADVTRAQEAIKKLSRDSEPPIVEIETYFQVMGKKIGKSLNSLANNTANQFLKMANGIQKVFMALPIIGAITMITATVKKMIDGISDYLNATTDAYYRQQKELASLNAIIQTTGASAWTSSGQLEYMAQNISKATGNSTNSIIEMQSRLLTYTNIVGANFDRASTAAVNMASVMKMDLTSAAELMGRALDSPIDGLSALTRQGFRFSEAVKEQIKLLTEQGRISEAQSIILTDVERAYNGVAIAQENVTGLSNRYKNVQEELNAEIGRSTSGFTNWWTSVKLSIAEARLFEMRQNRIASEISSNSQKVEEYTNKISNLKEELKNATGEEFIRIRVEIANAEEAREAILNDIANAEKIAKGANETYKNLLEGLQDRLDSYDKRIEKHHENIKKYQENGNTLKVIGENQDLNTTLEMRANLIEESGLNEARYRAESTKTNVARLIEKQNINLKEQEVLNREVAELTKLKALTDAITAADKKRKETIELSGAALANNRITQDEYNRQVQSAYTEEADQLAVIRMGIRNLNTDVIKSVEGKQALQNATDDVNRSLGTSISLEAKQKKLIEETAAVKKANETLTDNSYNILMLEAERRGNAQEILELEKQIALTKLKQEDYYKNAPLLQKDLENSLIKTIEIRRSTEADAQKMISENEKEYLLLMAKRTGNLLAIKDLEKAITLEKLKQTDTYKFADSDTQEMLIRDLERIDKLNKQINQESWLEEYQHKVKLVSATETERAKLAEEYAIKQLKNSDVYINAMATETMSIEEVREEMEKLLKLSLKIEKKEDDMHKKFIEGLNYLAMSISAVGDLMKAITKNVHDEQLRIIEEAYKAEMDLMALKNQKHMDMMEQDYQNLLYYNGLAKASTLEHFEADLSAAIMTGDHRLIYEVDRARKEFEIKKDYEEKVKKEEEKQKKEKEKIEKEYHQKKAELEHKAALQQWGIQLANTAASTAQAIMAAYAQGGPYVGPAMAAMMGSMGALQQAAILAAKPKLEKFDSGGIVLGHSFTGDNIITRQNSGEMDLNLQQQKNLFDAINKNKLGNDTPIIINTTIELDGDVIAEKVFEVGSLGNSFLRVRGIIK